MSYLITLILESYLDIKHWLKVKKRRKFERENNLPKKIMISPINKLWLIILIISIPILFLKFNRIKNHNISLTLNKISEIQVLLEEEKKQYGVYPFELKNIIRNNPLRKNITVDYWGNEFIYSLSKDSLNYTLVSSGKDEKLNTSDDINTTN